MAIGDWKLGSTRAIIAIMSEPVGYMERTRAYYAALGYEKPYVWAQFEDVPFTPLERPLSDATLTVITTAALYDRKPTDTRALASFQSANPPERLYANDLSWDKQATHMDDRNSYFPIDALNQCVASGRIGALAARFHCAATDYSIRRTLELDAPELLARAREDGADIALMVPL